MILQFLTTLSRTTRNVILAGLSIILLYTLLGFLFVPYLLKKEIKKSLDATYQVSSTIDTISFNPYTFELIIEGFNLPDKNKSLFKFKRLYVNLTLLPLITKEIKIQSISLEETDGQFIIFPNGKTNWTVSTPAKADKKNDTKKPWTLTLEKIELINNQFYFSDRTKRTPLDLPMGPINLAASNISTVIGKTSALDNLTLSLGNLGSLKLNGDISLSPPSAKLNFVARNFPLEFASAYLSSTTNLKIKKGVINLDGNLSYKNAQFDFNADSSLKNVVMINDISKEEAISWDSLNLDDFKFKTTPMSLHIKELELVSPVTKIQLKSNGVLNLKDFMRTTDSNSGKDAPKNNSKEITKTKRPFDFLISNLLVSKGNLDFADFQIKPNFQAHIDNINGAIGPISMNAGEKININLEGKVEAAGKFKSNGHIIRGDSSALNLDVNFANIELTTFTPYAGRFAGYEIKKGKLYLDLNYSLQNKRIKGKNNVRLDNFTLGDKVDSEHSTNLPVKFVLSLMKDRKGQIKFKLPVEGDVNSPSFSLGNLIWTALKNMIINIAMAPFDFLSSLVAGGDKLQFIQFEAGKSQLPVDQTEKIDQLSKILEERPELLIDLQGQFFKSDLIELKQKTSQKIEDPATPAELDALKTLAIERAQAIQKALILKAVNAERLYLLSGTGSPDDNNPPQVKLSLKMK